MLYYGNTWQRLSKVRNLMQGTTRKFDLLLFTARKTQKNQKRNNKNKKKPNKQTTKNPKPKKLNQSKTRWTIKTKQQQNPHPKNPQQQQKPPLIKKKKNMEKKPTKKKFCDMKTAKMDYTAVWIISRYFTSRSFYSWSGITKVVGHLCLVSKALGKGSNRRRETTLKITASPKATSGPW